MKCFINFNINRQMRYSIILLLLLFSARLSAQQVAVEYLGRGILYANIDNHLKIVVQGVSPKQIAISSKNGKVKKSDTAGVFIYNPSFSGFDTIYIFVNGKIIDQKRLIANPIPILTHLAGKHNGKISKSLLKHGISLTADVNGIDFSARIKIQNYSIMLIRNNNVIFRKDMKGYESNDEIAAQFQRLIEGDLIFVYNIIGKYPDGKLRELEYINLIVKD